MRDDSNQKPMTHDEEKAYFGPENPTLETRIITNLNHYKTTEGDLRITSLLQEITAEPVIYDKGDYEYDEAVELFFELAGQDDSFPPMGTIFEGAVVILSEYSDDQPAWIWEKQRLRTIFNEKNNKQTLSHPNPGRDVEVRQIHRGDGLVWQKLVNGRVVFESYRTKPRIRPIG